MLLMRQAVGKTKAKIILMSATMSLKPSLDYFKNDITTMRPSHFDITGKPAQSVEVVYLDDIVSDPPAFYIDRQQFSDLLMDLVLRHIDREFQRYPNKKDQGTVLVFLPGLDNIERMLERIKEDFGYRVSRPKSSGNFDRTFFESYWLPTLRRVPSLYRKWRKCTIFA
ncbi:hypothetical protein RvY_12930-2 [Ramazzottius varieornatus]|uniref:Uncharacterized protein n=1 Tax=Ramazzottius varieornatus TaxID=947166 RepID=A0A1D1VN48_RAMVA|nr:hypothetical protein RvY_12930-2 [Ramazzottius varieornatus]